MNVNVDQGKCQGNALCMAIAPEVFALTGDEKAHVHRAVVPAEVAPQVQRAISSCPEQAITIAN